MAGAVRPIDDLKLWGNVALTQARYANFDFEGFTGNTPSNVAPVIVNAGASYRFSKWRWPVEFGGSVRHVGNRYLFEDDATTMLAYTTADLFAFVDIPGKDLPWQGSTRCGSQFRVRNITNAVYAAWSDPGLPDQVLLGAPRTYRAVGVSEMVTSARSGLVGADAGQRGAIEDHARALRLCRAEAGGDLLQRARHDRGGRRAQALDHHRRRVGGQTVGDQLSASAAKVALPMNTQVVAPGSASAAMIEVFRQFAVDVVAGDHLHPPRHAAFCQGRPEIGRGGGRRGDAGHDLDRARRPRVPR